MPLNIVSSRPMRVMMTSDAVGGAWTYTLELTRYLSAHQIDVQVCTLGPKPSESQQQDALHAGAHSVEVTALPLDWTANCEEQLDRVADELQDRAAAFSADVVHLNAPALAGMQEWQCPLVATVHSCVATWWAATGHGAIPADLAWRAQRTAVGMRVAKSAIAPSVSFARDIARLYGDDVGVTVIHNGRVAPAAEGRARQDDLVFTAGRLWDAGKNLRIVDDAAWISDDEIYAAGPVSGPTGETIELPSLRHVGALSSEEMNTWYGRAGIFVSMSKYEPFGLAVLEAAQAEAALVLSDIPTFRELWDGAALFVGPDDAFALAGTLQYLAAHPSDRSNLGRAAKIRAAHYTAEKMGEQTLDVYRRLLSRRKHAFADREARA